jgi:hypothetical protein
MEQVLKESDNGILVYVSPTKALVNQIAAEVSARFSKDLKEGMASHLPHFFSISHTLHRNVLGSRQSGSAV